MNGPVRTTIGYGIGISILLWPATNLLAGALDWSMALRAMLWTSLAGYALFLARWSGRRKASLIFPLALLLTMVLWPGMDGAFICMTLGSLAWIRSGICFDRSPIRSGMAETITIAGGAGLVAALHPTTAVTWSLALWLFVLIQSLYFFIVPAPLASKDALPPEDPFEGAYRKALRILGGG